MKTRHTYLVGLMITFVLINLSVSARSFFGMDDSDELPDGISVQVFPNPSDGNFQLKLEVEVEGKVTAKIYDMTGKMVMDISDDLVKNDKSLTADINFQEATPGIHFLRIETGKVRITKKIVFR